MQRPQVDDLDILEVLGQGGCGRVYHAEGPNKQPLVLKIFDDSAINRVLLGNVMRRMAEGGWPEGVLPVAGGEFSEVPVFQISSLEADIAEDGTMAPRSLQHRLDQHPGPDSWKLVKSLADALAGMHARRIPHGNLKPGNVMFGGSGEVLLTDFALGNMPEVKHFHFTDALLYQPPEQLVDPSGYPDSLAAFGWDVFAFGVLSYRILTGDFPRCNDVFSKVAPASGESVRPGLQADVAKIARKLGSQPDYEWPDEARGPLEEGYREWIDRCLSLKVRNRPVSMVEVRAGFAAVDAAEAFAVERNALMDQRRHAGARVRHIGFALGSVVGITAVFAALWWLGRTKLDLAHVRHKDEIRLIQRASEVALAGKVEAETARGRAEQALGYERELWGKRLEASRLIGDRLFTWAMEKGHRRLPPLDGRELRLKRLDRYFEDFLTRTAEIPEFEDERARARLQLSEISLAAGNAAEATRRLDEALKLWSGQAMDADLKFRVATNTLLLALLRQSEADPATQQAFAAARTALSEVPRADVDEDRLDQLLAILDFHEAGLLSATGQDAKALEQLMRATQTLKRIVEQRPDCAVLRSELAACYLSSATILEGMGKMGDAREVQSLALLKLLDIHRKNPADIGLRLELAGCYATMAEGAVLAGDIGGAEAMAKEASGLLDRLLAEQPDHLEAGSRKAALLGLRAGIGRDRGKAEEAMKDYDSGIRMLEGIRASDPEDAMSAFRLAQLWWQKGRMLGMAGKRDEEIQLIGKARSVMQKLETRNPTSGPRPEQLQRSTAYLLGDLGHARQLAGQKKEASEAFSEAVELWQALLSSRPQSEEYVESLSWCRQRLQDLK